MARLIVIPLFFLSLVVLGRGMGWLLGSGQNSEIIQAVAPSGWSNDGPTAAVKSREGRWVRSGESAQAQENAINQNLANGDPMMNGDPIGEAEEYETTVNGVTQTRRRQETGLVTRIDSGKEKRFGDPGYTGE